MVFKCNDVITAKAINFSHEGLSVPKDHVHLLITYADFGLHFVFLFHKATLHALKKLWLLSTR